MKNLNHFKFLSVTTALLSIFVVTSSSTAQIKLPQRFVQIRSIDFETGVLELHNFGNAIQPLAGWRFCSHDEDQDRRYSSVGGLNSIALFAGESLFVHFNNDAVAANEINVKTIGGNFAQPLDTDGAYAIQIFYQTPFGEGTNIADHVQLSRFGADNKSADERSDEAQNGGTWTDENLWVSVLKETKRIVLRDSSSNNELHGPDDYVNEFDFLLGDVNCDDAVNLLDVDPFISSLGGGEYSAKADANLDGVNNLLDVTPFINLISGN